jgi:hypothetical protein
LKEAQHFKDDLQINLRKDIASGRIIKISMPIEEIQTVIKKACENRLDIQAGEAESIAAFMSQVVSFEKCLKGVKSCKLPYKLTKKAMQRWKAEAIQRIG